jgi:hypothetical protein
MRETGGRVEEEEEGRTGGGGTMPCRLLDDASLVLSGRGGRGGVSSMVSHLYVRGETGEEEREDVSRGGEEGGAVLEFRNGFVEGRVELGEDGRRFVGSGGAGPREAVMRLVDAWGSEATSLRRWNGLFDPSSFVVADMTLSSTGEV